MKRLVVLVLAVLLLAGGCTTGRGDVVVGAMYPTAGGQGPGGIEEYRGVRLAAEFANERGGVHGRRIRLELVPANSSDGVPSAMRELMKRGAKVVAGSYGSTMSAVAAEFAARREVVFWETGAVGLLPQVANHHTFRVPATGESLGRIAVEFVRDVYIPRHAPGARPRYGVAYVDDVYGSSVGLGAINRIKASGVQPVTFTYGPRTKDFDAIARRIEDARIDVLVVGAYLDDGIALRRAIVRERVPLIANIGTSSSFCMPEFGRRLGADAVGAFASDKPDAFTVPDKAVTPKAATVLRWAEQTYKKRYREEMTAPALTGFSGAWALFHSVLPAAERLDVKGIVAAARAVRIPDRGLPNGSGLAFDAKGAGPSENLRAASVIWQWVAPNKRVIVWPPAFATHAIERA